MASYAVPVIDPIPLRSKPVSFTPKEFYVSSVADERSDIKKLSLLVESSPNSKKILSQAATLKGGDFHAVKQFILNSLPRNHNLRPVTILVKKFEIAETATGPDRVNGQVSIVLNFKLEKDGGSEQLIKYEGSARYTRPLASLTVIEPAIARTLTEALKYFNTWIDREAPGNVKLAKGIKLYFEEYGKQDPDTVYYMADRPLTWDDFRDVPRNNRYAAEIFAGFGFDQQIGMKDGILHVTIITKVFVPKSASWVRPGNQNAYALNHEQRHFDIARIIAGRFKDRALAAGLTAGNYESYLGPQYLEALRELTRLQLQYDAETRHGSDRLAQELWNKKIDDELSHF